VKFEDSILQTITEKLKLRRMRFKIDPAISNLEDFDGNTSYEGYVLNENEGVLNILVVDPNNQVRQTAVFAKGLNVLSNNLNEFKRNLIRLILNKVPEQVLQQIQNSSTFDEVELLAKQNGGTDDDIKNAYRSFNTESALNEQGPLGKAAQKATDTLASVASKIPGAKSGGLVRRTLGKAADIGKDVAFGKDAKTLGQKVAGAYNIMGRIGKTLQKTKTGGFDFKQRSSMFHKDRPRTGQEFSIDFKKDGAIHTITGTVFGNKVSGKDSYIQLKNVIANPPIKQYEKIDSILVDFDLNSPDANFYIYDDSKKMKDSFSGNLVYDSKTKNWVVENTSESTIQVKTGEKQKNEKQAVASQQNIKILAQNKGYESFEEPYGKGRLLYKIKDENIYFDSNYNKQTPKLKP